MGLICKYGVRECLFCEDCFEKNESERKTRCSVCGKRLKADKIKSSGAFINICPLCYSAIKYGGI